MQPATPAEEPAYGTGPEVKEIQRLLKAIGFDPKPIDGIPGPLTEAAIKDFQRARGLVVDGRPTAALLSALRREVPNAR
ncbi:MAG: peptidoglycan-binding protein [bacterium]|nr:peptidoglycan-binding protein [bacterium]